MGRRKSHKTRVSSDDEEDSSFFKDFSVDFKSFRVQWGLLSMTEIHDLTLSDQEMSRLLLSQLQLHDSVIESLITRLNDAVAKGRELEEEVGSLRRIVREGNRSGKGSQFDNGHKYAGSRDTHSLSDSSDDNICKDSKDNVRGSESSLRVRSKRGSDSPEFPSHRLSSSSKKKGRSRKDKNSMETSSSDDEKDMIKAFVTKALRAQGYGSSGKSELDRDCKKNDREDSDVGWNTEGEKSITEQVKAVASETVVQSGYVYHEDYGLYYDHSSGYYYNAENGLYSDPKTGTYFFYDHNTQSYQFHSQVPVEGNSEADAEAGKENVDGGRSDASEMGSSSVVYPPENQSNITPSVRLMVTESGVDEVKVGDLHIVTKDGGRLGRKSDNLIQLLDVSVSKDHAEFVYHSNGPDDHHYFIKDLGSILGTYINGTCICIPGEPSGEIEIGHGWELQFGTVKMKCHIHPGYLSCNECEPGLVRAKMSSQKSAGGSEKTSLTDKSSVEKARLKILKAIKKKYAVNPHKNPALPLLPAEYADRAKKRRKEVGSDNPYEKTEVASTETELKDNNKGFKLLSKMGWSKGQSLGKSQPGIVKPIEATSTVGREGLGYGGLGRPTPTAEQLRRKKILDITVERFKSK